MTHTFTNGPVSRTTSRPGRRTLVGLAVTILVLFAVMIATSHEIAYDTSTEDIEDIFDTSRTVNQISSYAGMVVVALVLFFGGALRNALRSSSRNWFADPAFLGFAALGATFATWTVSDAALWLAVDGGNENVIRTLATVSDVSFLPLMAAMIALYGATGLAGITTGCLPRWLAIGSIVVAVITPIGPLGFVGFVLLPFWLVAVAVWVRLDA